MWDSWKDATKFHGKVCLYSSYTRTDSGILVHPGGVAVLHLMLLTYMDNNYIFKFILYVCFIYNILFNNLQGELFTLIFAHSMISKFSHSDVGYAIL